MSQKTLLDKDLQDHYEQLFAMYGTRGWKRLQEQIEQMLASNNSVAGVDTVEQLWFRKGELSQMLWLQSHQAVHEAAYNQLIADQAGEDAEPGTGGRARVTE